MRRLVTEHGSQTTTEEENTTEGMTYPIPSQTTSNMCPNSVNQQMFVVSNYDNPQDQVIPNPSTFNAQTEANQYCYDFSSIPQQYYQYQQQPNDINSYQQIYQQTQPQHNQEANFNNKKQQIKKPIIQRQDPQVPKDETGYENETLQIENVQNTVNPLKVKNVVNTKNLDKGNNAISSSTFEIPLIIIPNNNINNNAATNTNNNNIKNSKKKSPENKETAPKFKGSVVNMSQIPTQLIAPEDYLNSQSKMII
ncbi:hypothetical protein BLOT_007086 [Blomia tropicalis]|nr:hypothetical protein BLOT_007086 [Blomia tropicalis]